MLKLSTKPISSNAVKNGMYKVTKDNHLRPSEKNSLAFLVQDEKVPKGFNTYIAIKRNEKFLDKNLPHIVVSDDLSYLDQDDIFNFYENDSIRVLYRSDSNQNSFLITEQCNHYCLMCSQPPKNIDDSFIIQELEKLIPMIPKYTKELGFTGGEPTLFGNQFLNLLSLCKQNLPETAVHILSNGRAFKEHNFVKQYAAINHPDMMVGIPIYSDDPELHNYIVQAENAFDETIMGILNLKKLNQKVEIRIVLHKQSIKRLKQLCEFIGRNLLFVDHVALMGLEMFGFTRANMDELWIDPFDYKDLLSEATAILDSYHINTSIYNHQLCLVNDDVLPFYRKAISDWKNEYAKECKGCNRSHECGGFFSSQISVKYSDHIRAFHNQNLKA